ncbi:hypothetical protein SANA_01310 [Gottschalkiaceae bacterium SANA]|nr:hypothetical protein SANA_01310 [Gottschalkiaceae bacterium SANA]
MNRDNRVIIIPIIFAFLFTIVAGIYGVANGTFIGIKSLFILFGCVGIFSFVVSLSIQALKDIIVDFFDSNNKGKIIIVLILLTYILRALYQMSLAK